jgi:hypothetical protein
MSSQVDPHPPYWFPAKRYGWGWGFPITWQGWVVMVLWLAAVVAAACLLAGRSLALYGIAMLILSGLMIAICYAKGEPPRWRWGDKD